MTELWSSTSKRLWKERLDRYSAVIEAQGVKRLAEHEEWYSTELPDRIYARSPPYVTLEELARVTEWKMARGVWRARNLSLVRGNDPEEVERFSQLAFGLIPDVAAPVRELSRLGGVGPATASAVLAAVAPEHYPFFDELAAKQITNLGTMGFTPKFYSEYTAAIRQKATELGPDWTPAMVERALWANAGGKSGKVPE